MNILSVAIGTIVLLVWTQASAAIVTATWAGTVSVGLDRGGYFGAPGADLTGDPFSLIFSFDTSKGSFVKDPGDTLEGGAPYAGEGASPGSALLTIAGQAVQFSGGYFSAFGVSPSSAYGGGGAGNTHGFSVLEASQPQLNFVSISAYKSPELLNSMTTTYSGDPCIGAVDCGGFFGLGTSNALESFGNLAASSYTLSFDSPFIDPLAGTPDPGVPEPASWALMLFGAFGAGSVLRFKRAWAV